MGDRPSLAFDASPLIHFARANRLETLQAITVGFRCVVTRAVLEEVEQGVLQHEQLRAVLDASWLEVVPVEELDELYRFAEYLNILGNTDRNAGEATVLAWAETHGASAYLDDQVACNTGRSRGVPVFRTLALIIDGFRQGLLQQNECEALVRQLMDTGARLPLEKAEDLFPWARHESLL